MANGMLILDLWYSESASSTLPILLRAWVTSLQVRLADFWSQTSSTALRHSSSVSLMVKISSSRSSSMLSSSPSFCHWSVTVGCSLVKRVSRVRGLPWQARYGEEWGGKGWKNCNDGGEGVRQHLCEVEPCPLCIMQQDITWDLETCYCRSSKLRCLDKPSTKCWHTKSLFTCEEKWC